MLVYPMALRSEELTERSMSSWHKFGYASDVDNADGTVDVWDYNLNASAPQLYPFQTTASTLTVTSTDDTDTSAGVGARTVKITGLDSNYDELEETVSMNGTAGVTTTNSFVAVNRAYVATGGSSKQVAHITITHDTSGDILALISNEARITTQSPFTVPNGKKALITRATSSLASAGTNDLVRFELRYKPAVTDAVCLAAGNIVQTSESMSYEFDPPIELPSKTQIYMRMYNVGTTNNLYVTLIYSFILVDE